MAGWYNSVPDLSTSYAIIGSTSRIDIGATLLQALYDYAEIPTDHSVGPLGYPPDECEEIGGGESGVMFALNNGSMAIKLARDPSSSELWHGYNMSKHIFNIFTKYNITGVNLTGFKGYVSRDNPQFWTDTGLEEKARSILEFPANALLTERIPPVPISIQHSLIHAFCDKRSKAQAMDNLVSDDCLVHLYFGSMNDKAQHSEDLSRHDFELHLNHMLVLDLNKNFYFAIMRDMATALATMHWAARIDAKGVKFVLGGPRRSPIGMQTQEMAPTRSSQVSVWMFDFEKTQSIPLSKEGVAKAVEAYMNNDPYCPRPFQGDDFGRYPWVIFEEAYLCTSRLILHPYESYAQAFPSLFIKWVKVRERANRGL
ncbi:hypothetical protein FSARC_9672 [Fusarium sarcochroum]|uniref:DUF3669 domain-containing protein n=1 Tax=Fusarium sarcochroum TaxID=1208366 RepID=A0A8H4TQU8_9HYPO|nr:hypothetical protein FSARC_9672 [Fusarium sarcochroum]